MHGQHTAHAAIKHIANTKTDHPHPIYDDGVTGWAGQPGGHSGEPAPDPIPNSAVKIPSANGTASQGAEE